MIDETQVVVLAPVTDRLWTGIRGEIACHVEQRGTSYHISVEALRQSRTLESYVCRQVSCVQGFVAQFGFRFIG